jgi:hypothetical protein
MSMLLKIQNGTGRSSGKPLCFSCIYSVIRSDDDVVCSFSSFNHIQIDRPIYQCNRYYNNSLPKLADLEEIAWELKTNAGGRSMGFSPPKPKEDDRPRYK